MHFKKKNKNNKILYKIFSFIIFTILVITIIPHMAKGQEIVAYSKPSDDGYAFVTYYSPNYGISSIDVNCYLVNVTNATVIANYSGSYHHASAFYSVHLTGYINTTYQGKTHYLISILGKIPLAEPATPLKANQSLQGVSWTFMYPHYGDTVDGGFATISAGPTGFPFEVHGPTSIHFSIVSQVLPVISGKEDIVPYYFLPLSINVSTMFIGEYIQAYGAGMIDSSLIVGSGGSCVSGSTPILMANMSYVLAKDISIGDQIATYNISTGEIQNGTVIGITTTYENYYYIINGNLILAGDQKILTNDGYIEAENLTLNDSVYNVFTNEYMPILFIINISQPMVMYDFLITVNHNYIGWYYVLEDRIADPCG